MFPVCINNDNSVTFNNGDNINAFISIINDGNNTSDIINNDNSVIVIIVNGKILTLLSILIIGLLILSLSIMAIILTLVL